MIDSTGYIISSSATSISISWDKQRVPRDQTGYTIKYRKDLNVNFTFKQTEHDYAEIDELQSDTEYEVNVYWEKRDGGTKELFKVMCKTKRSSTDYLKNQHTSEDKSRKPVLYQFKPVQMREEKGNYQDRTTKSKADSVNDDGLRICDMIAEYNPGIQTSKEKTVLLLGATGTGKSTLVDGLINYIAGVSYNDDYRFSLIYKTGEERIQSETQVKSQTSAVTVYRIPELEGSKVNCKVNIIDTIGFLDTREHFDEKLTTQLQTLFGKVIEHLDAILIVIPLSTKRLTYGQEYVFSSIAKLFGDDIKNNICVAITHDDGGEPTCLGLLERAVSKIPQSKVFRFNNSFVLNKQCESDEDLEQPDLVQANARREEYWKQRAITFSRLFHKLNELPKTTVESSHDVMVARHRLQIQLKALEKKVVEQVQRIVNYKRAKKFEEQFKQNTDKTDQKFTKKVSVYKHQHTGRTSINCRNCKQTCHEGCWVPLDVLNWTCEAIVDDKCIVCEKNCSVKDHVREKYEYVLSFEEKVMTIAEFVESFEESFLEFLKTIDKVKTFIEELESKAMRPEVLSTQVYIEQIMQKNYENKQDDFKARGEVLAKVKDHMEKGVCVRNLQLKDLIE